MPIRSRLLAGFAAAALMAGVAACSVSAPSATVTGADADRFLADANQTLLRLGIEEQRASWVAENFITTDTEALAARADQIVSEASARLAKESVKFDHVDVSPDARRQLQLLKVALTVAAPADPRDAAELARILASLDAAYGRGKWCKDATRPESCLDVDQITNVMAASRNPAELREVWEGWHAIGTPMRSDYVRFVDLANRGARELGFADTGALWRSKYDMPPDAFAKELDRLWDQVRPLYLSLHAYVRMRLHQKYGDAVPANGPIPAHMLGNIWAQDWSNVYSLAAPAAVRQGLLAQSHPRQPEDDVGGHDEDRRALLHVAGLRSAAADVLAAIAVRQAARSRRRVPRQRVGYRRGERPARQGLPRTEGRGLPDDPPRAGPQLLSARLQHAASALPRQRERWLPRSHRRHDCAVGHAGVPGEDRPARQGASSRRATSACCSRERSTRSPSCHSGC